MVPEGGWNKSSNFHPHPHFPLPPEYASRTDISGVPENLRVWASGLTSISSAPSVCTPYLPVLWTALLLTYQIFPLLCKDSPFPLLISLFSRDEQGNLPFQVIFLPEPPHLPSLPPPPPPRKPPPFLCQFRPSHLRSPLAVPTQVRSEDLDDPPFSSVFYHNSRPYLTKQLPLFAVLLLSSRPTLHYV